MPWPRRMCLVRAAALEHLGRGGMRVFVAEMMLDLPGVVVAEPVGQDDLVERLLEEAMLVAGRPRLRQLQFIEDAEAHGGSSLWSACYSRSCASRRRRSVFNILP